MYAKMTKTLASKLGYRYKYVCLKICYAGARVVAVGASDGAVSALLGVVQRGNHGVRAPLPGPLPGH